jgi:pimeloyl-ACP methyl ester carboxylesterase
VMQGRDDGVDPPSAADHDRPHFTGPYRRVVLDGVGHNPPQEAPEAFAAAVRSLA